MQPAKETKWIEDLEPDMPIAQAARHVLGVRLQAVILRLAPALECADNDPEHVHQLRVSTRRAAAALRIFQDCLPGKHFRRVRRQLRRLRRAAGPIRDWDVFLETLTAQTTRTTASQRPGIDYSLGYAEGQRAAARARLLEDSDDSLDAAQRIREDALAALGPPEKDTTLAKQARATLSELLADLADAARQVAGDKKKPSPKAAPLADAGMNYEHLHRVRIFGKRLRYAMEVFSCCFPKEFRTKIYAAVEKLQEILGHANDSHVAQEHFRAMCDRLQSARPTLWQRFKPGIQRMLTFHQRRLERQRRQFLAWWAKWHGSQLESSFRQMLK